MSRRPPHALSAIAHADLLPVLSSRRRRRFSPSLLPSSPPFKGRLCARRAAVPSLRTTAHGGPSAYPAFTPSPCGHTSSSLLRSLSPFRIAHSTHSALGLRRGLYRLNPSPSPSLPRPQRSDHRRSPRGAALRSPCIHPAEHRSRRRAHRCRRRPRRTATARAPSTPRAHPRRITSLPPTATSSSLPRLSSPAITVCAPSTLPAPFRVSPAAVAAHPRQRCSVPRHANPHRASPPFPPPSLAPRAHSILRRRRYTVPAQILNKNHVLDIICGILVNANSARVEAAEAISALEDAALNY
ncbi:hypothetical protein C8R46DRAFT_1331080 [Mycena filopes]|nr:hypothetical protein C8R46DRAFT_1331080 [Mycena filopes]